MKTQMEDLVSMRDVESLYEIMTEDEDWMLQLDAAEGLIELDDRRGYDYLQSALDSDIPDMAEAAQEILDSPRGKAMEAQIEGEKKRQHEVSLVEARKRLAEGRKVYRYKAVYLVSGEFLQEAMFGEGFDIEELNQYGLEGWEVVNVLPNLVAGTGSHFGGIYLLMKKEITAKDAAELEKM